MHLCKSFCAYSEVMVENQRPLSSKARLKQIINGIGALNETWPHLRMMPKGCESVIITLSGSRMLSYSCKAGYPSSKKKEKIKKSQCHPGNASISVYPSFGSLLTEMRETIDSTSHLWLWRILFYTKSFRFLCSPSNCSQAWGLKRKHQWTQKCSSRPCQTRDQKGTHQSHVGGAQNSFVFFLCVSIWPLGKYTDMK